MTTLHRQSVIALAAFALLTVAIAAMACAGPSAEPAASQPAAAQSAAVPTETSAPAEAAAPAAADTPVPLPDTPVPATEAPAAASAAPSSTDTPAPSSSGAVGLVFALAEGTIARYKVEEELANTGFKVATGETTDVAGQVVFDPDGGVVADQSRIAVQAAALRTDSNRRDGYVRSRTLQTDTYPEVVFVPTSVDGLPTPVTDASGAVEFTITGDLTVKDQTREVTWDAMADFGPDGAVSGMASVQFTFDDFGMDKPRVAIVVSVDDAILLELDFSGTISSP